MSIKNRIKHDDAGALDEVVTDGGAHLERMDDRDWFLNCIRSDGSSFAVWIEGKVTMTEERSPEGTFFALQREVYEAADAQDREELVRRLEAIVAAERAR